MPLELVPREEDKPPLWLNILFYFSIVLLLSVAPAYYTLKNFQEKADAAIVKIKKEITDTKSVPRQWVENEDPQSPDEKEKELKKKKEKIDNFSEVIKEHKLVSKIFLGAETEGGKRGLGWIEKMTHPRVVFSNFNLDAKKAALSLSGTTESFQTLEQQIIIFEQERGEVESVNVSQISLGKEGDITFALNLSLNPQILK